MVAGRSRAPDEPVAMTEDEVRAMAIRGSATAPGILPHARAVDRRVAALSPSKPIGKLVTTKATPARISRAEMAVAVETGKLPDRAAARLAKSSPQPATARKAGRAAVKDSPSLEPAKRSGK